MNLISPQLGNLNILGVMLQNPFSFFYGITGTKIPVPFHIPIMNPSDEFETFVEDYFYLETTFPLFGMHKRKAIGPTVGLNSNFSVRVVNLTEELEINLFENISFKSMKLIAAAALKDTLKLYSYTYTVLPICLLTIKYFYRANQNYVKFNN